MKIGRTKKYEFWEEPPLRKESIFPNIEKLKKLGEELRRNGFKSTIHVNTPLGRQASLIYHQMSPENIKSAELEGSVRSVVCKDLLEKIEAFLKSHPEHTEKFTQVKKQLNQALLYCIQIENLQGEEVEKLGWPQEEIKQQKTLKDIVASCKDDIQKLSPGESFMLPAGTRDHTVVYEILKKDNGKYTLTLINTGLGINIGHKINEEGRVRTLVYDDLEEEVFDTEFLESIVTFVVDIKEKEWDEIYKFLDGKLKKDDNKKEGRLHKQQREGICASKSLSVWLHSKIAPGMTSEERNVQGELLYETFKLDILNQNLTALKENSELQKHIRENVKIEVKRFRNISLIQKFIIGNLNWAKEKLSANKDPKFPPMTKGAIKVVDFLSNGFNKRINADQNVEFLKKRLNKKITKVESKIEGLSKP